MSIEEDTKIIEDTEEPVKEETNELIQKPKVKKPRSEKQIKAFEVARQKLAEKRKVNRANKDKELAVKIKEKELEQRKVKEVNQKFEELVVNDEEEDNEPVIITKPKARKKKAQKIVVEEEDESGDSEPEIIIRRVKKGRKKKQEEPEPPTEPRSGTPPLPVEEPIQQEEQPLAKRYSNAQLLRVFGM